MAIMINSSTNFDPLSHEDLIWESLKKLPDDWYVFHSIHIFDPHVDDYNGKQEVEIDFVVLVPSKGCVVIEAKSGEISFTTEPTSFQGESVPPFSWIYSSGRPMNPFEQSRNAMYCLLQYISSKNLVDFVKRENFYNCVWFHQISSQTVASIPDRPEAPKGIILTSDSLKDPKAAILQIIKFESEKIAPKSDPWNLQDISYVARHVLAPAMRLCPSKNWEYDLNNEKLNALLAEQERVLEFLSEQKLAVISGAAGTGKTMLALKKAQMEAEIGHTVLFLCFNSALCDYLSTNYAIKDYVDYFTLDKWACKLCKTSIADMGALALLIHSLVDQGKFGYKAVIVDEAQDFGQDVSDNKAVNILAELNDAMILNDGCFYAFYDKNQVVNSKKVPSFIANADCKLTLYRNCRNTEKIAETSFSLLDDRPKLIENAVSGDMPSLYFNEPGKTFAGLSKVIKDLTDSNYKQIVILTVKKCQASCLKDYVDGQKIKINNQIFPFYSCAQYKGLESDSVVLVDITKETFLDDRQKLLFYVGASRAKFKLSIVTEMTNEDCKAVDQVCLGSSFLDGADYKTEFSLVIASSIKEINK